MSMEDIDLTDGQLRVLLNMTRDLEAYTPQIRSLVTALHSVGKRGAGWVTQMSKQDIETAIDMFEDYQRSQHAPSASQFLRLLVGSSVTAQQICADRKAEREAQRG